MMIKYFKHYVILFTFMMFVGCVPSYYSTFNANIIYNKQNNRSGNIELLYCDTCIHEMNEALGKDLVLIPVKIQNNDTISFLFKANNLIVYNDYEPIRIMDKKEFYRNAKTKTIKYYAIGTIGLIMGVGKSSEGIEINYYHPGRLLTVFAIWQLFKAKKLNKSLKKDLDKYYLDNIVIQPKGFIERYVCVNVGEPKNLTLQIK